MNFPFSLLHKLVIRKSERFKIKIDLCLHLKIVGHSNQVLYTHRKPYQNLPKMTQFKAMHSCYSSDKGYRDVRFSCWQKLTTKASDIQLWPW